LSSDWTRRRFLSRTLGSAVLTPPGAKPDELICGISSGLGERCMEVFEDAFTRASGIPIGHSLAMGAEQYSALKARSTSALHVVNLQDRYLHRAARAGLLAVIDYTLVPNAEPIADIWRQPAWLGYMHVAVGIVYNAQAVGEPPRDWTDLLDGRYRGRVAIDRFGRFGLHTLLALAFAHGGGYTDMEPGFRLIRKFTESGAVLIRDPQHGMRLLRDGRVDAALWSDARARLLQREERPIEYVAPLTGDVQVAYGNAIALHSGYQDWSATFLNFTATPQLQTEFASGIYPASPTHPQAVMALRATQPDAHPPGGAHIVPDYDEILPRLGEWSRRWNAAIAG
jgi:putative spermidine/putrescine transport system substrate-binding protein